MLPRLIDDLLVLGSANILIVFLILKRLVCVNPTLKSTNIFWPHYRSAERFIFIGDRIANIKSAKTAGILSHLFENEKKIVAFLHSTLQIVV